MSVCLAISACSTEEYKRGYVTEFSDFNKVEIGKTNKEEALKLLGSPSSISTFGKEIWYYVGMKLQRGALLEDEVANQDVVVVTFDEAGVVNNITRRSEQDRRAIAVSDESTPTEGNEITIMEQLLGNLGRFNPKE